MKKILNFLGVITLIGAGATNLVACNTPQYTSEELTKLKEKNKINTTNQEIRDNLEWITPQENPFDQVDNRWYFVIWKANKWIITKYKNDKYEKYTGWIIEEINITHNRYRLMMRPNADFGAFSNNRWRKWKEYIGSYFRGVYRWNLDIKEPDLIIDNNNNLKINE